MVAPSRSILSIMVATVILAFLPLYGVGAFYVSVAFLVAMSIVLASSWIILSGYTGYVNFGHAAFFGVGVYTVGGLTFLYGFDPLLVAPLAGLMAAAVAAGIGYPCLRLRGDYFAITTLALTFILMIYVANTPTLGDGIGLFMSMSAFHNPHPALDRISWLFEAMLVLAAVTVTVSYLIPKSRFGMGLIAIREDEDAAETTGIPTFRYKMIAFAISGGLAGVAGGLFPYYQVFIDPPSSFSILISINAVVMAALGGMRDWRGPVIGATILTLLSLYLAFTITSALNMVILGLILIAIITVMPRGIIGFLQRGKHRSTG